MGRVMEILNTAVGLMSLVLGAGAIWLSLHFYEKSKDSEKATAVALEAIRAQSEALQKLTARWMDRFTKHATSPRETDEGLLALVSAVTSLPATILAQVRLQSDGGASVEAHRHELVSTYIGLFFYALGNVALQNILSEVDEDGQNDEVVGGIARLINQSAADFRVMLNTLEGVDRTRLESNPLRPLLMDTNQNWRPFVGNYVEIMARSQTANTESDPPSGDAAARSS